MIYQPSFPNSAVGRKKVVSRLFFF